MIDLLAIFIVNKNRKRKHDDMSFLFHGFDQPRNQLLRDMIRIQRNVRRYSSRNRTNSDIQS